MSHASLAARETAAKEEVYETGGTSDTLEECDDMLAYAAEEDDDES